MAIPAKDQRFHNWKEKTTEYESREFKMTLPVLHCGRHGHPDHHLINIAQAAGSEGNRFNRAEPSLSAARGQHLCN
jgi:hypothetical protein